jgi:anti-anti-sigma factor
MECTTREIANVLLVQVGGRIDHTTAQAFEDALLPALGDCASEKKALLDLSGVAYMSSAGLRVLILAAKQCQQQKGDISLAGLQPMVREVFKISHFDTIFTVFATVPAALEALSPAAASLYSGV